MLTSLHLTSLHLTSARPLSPEPPVSLSRFPHLRSLTLAATRQLQYPQVWGWGG